jgi:hypothetical protein
MPTRRARSASTQSVPPRVFRTSYETVFLSTHRSYDPVKSGANVEKIAMFVGADLEGPLSQIPGIGADATAKLAEVGITTSFQLLGKFLTFKGEVGGFPSARCAFPRSNTVLHDACAGTWGYASLVNPPVASQVGCYLFL